MGLPFNGIIGFGIDFVYSDILVPKPPAKITTFILIRSFNSYLYVLYLNSLSSYTYEKY